MLPPLQTCAGKHDQQCAHTITRDPPPLDAHPADPRLHTAWGKRLWLGIIPARWV